MTGSAACMTDSSVFFLELLVFFVIIEIVIIVQLVIVIVEIVVLEFVVVLVGAIVPVNVVPDTVLLVLVTSPTHQEIAFRLHVQAFHLILRVTGATEDP
jgi:hypothetical protein